MCRIVALPAAASLIFVRCAPNCWIFCSGRQRIMRNPKLLARQRVQQLAQGPRLAQCVEQSRQEMPGRRKAGKEASCALKHTWKRRWIHSAYFYKNRTKTRASVSRRAKASRCFRARARAPWRSPWRGETAPRGLMVVLRTARARGGSRWGYQTPAFAGKDRSWPPRSIAVSRRPAVRKRHLQPRAVVAFQASGHSRLPRKKRKHRV